MATNIHRVLENFKWRIEAIAPTSTTSTREFIWYDELVLDADQSAGMTRGFNVHWLGRGPAHEVDDLIERVAIHRIQVTVAYSTQFELLKRQQLMLQDAHDLIKVLRDDRYWVGYSDSATSTDIGLFDRSLDGDEVITEPLTWYYRQTWLCHVHEVE